MPALPGAHYLLISMSIALIVLLFGTLGQPASPIVGGGAGVELLQGISTLQVDSMVVVGSEEAEETVPRQELFRIRVQMAFTALTLAFALLHLILFVFLPGLRSNLYFAVYLFFFSVALFFDFQHLITNSIWQVRMHRAFLSLSLVFSLRFFYELFLPKPPRQFLPIAVGILIAGILATVSPQLNFKYLLFMSMVHWIEVTRVEIQAIRKKQEGAWIIAAGFGVFYVFGTYDMLLDVDLMRPVYGIDNAYQFGLVGLFIATAVYLARDMARTNDKLITQERRGREQEVEQRVLAAEVARTTKELEQARELQLSMLPDTLPLVPSLDIAVHMQTATEVGGDYYDFHLAPDGVLTVAIGDATGHGIKAGMMVAIVKSMFKGSVSEPDILRFFERCTRTLKQMHLGNLFMGLTMLIIRQGHLVASAAGMPPMLIFRAQKGEVETVTLKGMPLGAFQSFPYQQYQTELLPGDTVLLMTDGFPELFNDKREMMGLARTEMLFGKVASQTPKEIIMHLVETGRAWRTTQQQDDDMTFVVLKVRSTPSL